MDFMSIRNSHKPIAIWSWNEKLNTEDTLNNARHITDGGFGSFCISASYGLSSRFLGEEWMRNVASAINHARENCTNVWLRDTDGIFSGRTSAAANISGDSGAQLFLRCEAAEKTNDRTIIFKDGYHFYYDVNPYYVDIFNSSVAMQLVNDAYIPYFEKFSEGIDTFMCSPMPVFSESIPWSFSFPAAYKNAYGEELLDCLIELFRPVGNYTSTRIKFYSLVLRLFSENFVKPVYDCCEEHNVKLSLSYSSEALLQGSSMLCFDYSHLPCVESFSRNDSAALPALMASSFAQQTAHKESFSIILSNSGYGAAPDDFKRIAQQHLVRGITGIIFPGVSSSLRGSRKYLTPVPSINYEAQTKLNNYISTISSLLMEGAADFETLLIYSTDMGSEEAPLSAALNTAIEALEKKHIPFHVADEFFIQKYARADGDSFVLGNMRYKTVVLSLGSQPLESTTRLLSEFESGGGFITVAESLCKNEICDNENLLYTYRSYPGYKLHYLVNNSPAEFTSAISFADKMIDINTGDVIPFYGIYKFSPYEGILLVDDGTPQQSRPFKKIPKTLCLGEDWTLSASSENALVLDKCDVYFDNILHRENENCADVIELATQMRRPLQIDCIYTFNVSRAIGDVFLAIDNPDAFSVAINDVFIDKVYDGYFINKTFSRINISSYLCEGENKISLRSFYTPSDDFLLSYEKALESSLEIPSLRYSLEISPIYITGDFAVSTDGEFRRLDKNAFRYQGAFSINCKKDLYSLSSLHSQGFPFFSGTLSFTKTFNLSDTSYCIKMNPLGISSVSICVNGKKADTLIWQPYECDISDLLKKGDNEITITLHTTARNLFGPHHIPLGELYKVTQGDFYRNPCVWNAVKPTPWDNNYCFTELGINSLE